VKKIAVGLLVVMLVASSFVGFSPVNAANFSDVPKTHQYYKYITKLADAGIVKGRSTTQYAPNANLSRAELATLLVNLKKLPLETSKQYFNDVKPGTWYYGYVNAAAKAGLVAGYGDGTYRPNNPVTRAELAVVGLRGLGVTQATIDQYAKNPIYLSSDESKYTNYWAKGWLTAAIMPRYQVLSWRQPGKLIAADKAATRGEAAYTIYKAKWPVKKGGQLYVIEDQEPATLFYSLDDMAAMIQVLGFVMDRGQGSDWRQNWWPEMERWVPTTENGKQLIYEKPQTIELQDGTKVPIYMRYDFGLRHGLKWADGEPITADDLIFTVLLYLAKNMPVYNIDPYDSVARIEKLDDYTIRVYFTSIDPQSPYNIYAKYGFLLYPKHWFEENVLKSSLNIPKTVDFVLKHNENLMYVPDESYTLPRNLKETMDKYSDDIASSSFNTKPLYSGPYKVTNWVQKSYIELQPDPNFFLGPGLFDKVVISFRSAEAGLAELLKGQPDVALMGVVNTQNAKTLSTNESFLKTYKLNSMPSTYFEHFVVNFDDPKNLPKNPKPGVAYTHPLLSDIRVRQALSYGINRQDISNRVYYGMRPVCYNFILPGTKYDEPSLKNIFVYDPGKATTLLQQAGFTKGTDGIYAKGGTKLSLLAQTTNRSDRISALQVIQQQYKQVGINLTIQPMDSGPFFNTLLPHRNFELALFAWGQDSILEPGNNSLYQSRFIPSETNGYQGQNYGGFRNAEADALISKWNSFNTPERIQAYKDFCKNFYAVYMPEIPLYWQDQHDAVKLNIEGYDMGIDVSAHTWNSAWWYRE